VRAAFVVLSPQEHRFRAHDWSAFGARIASLYCGGPTRSASVANGLAAMASCVDLGDWVLVHDAARPCLPVEDLRRLLDETAEDPVGGLLGAPVADTLKRADGDARAAETVDRTGLWQALTPQVFRMGMLLQAMESARAARLDPTDEAAAVERLGYRPRLVLGSRSNVKITYAEDLRVAARLLSGA